MLCQHNHQGEAMLTPLCCAPTPLQEGDKVVFTIRNPPPPEIRGTPCIGVSYENFVEDVEVGLCMMHDAGMLCWTNM